MNGVVVLPPGTGLPEGAKVQVEPLKEEPANGQGESLLTRLGDVVGAIDDLPEDLAAQHDHYLYGTPKRP